MGLKCSLQYPEAVVINHYMFELGGLLPLILT